MKGVYQEHNLQTAFVALQVLRNICGIALDTQAIAKGFAHVCDLTGLRGRWETISTLPLTICDTGHNSHGIRYVAEQLYSLLAERRMTHPDAQLRIVLGMVNDKDIDDVLALLPVDAVYYFTQPHTSRALSAEAMYSKWMALHPDHLASRSYEQALEALRLAQSEASSADIIFVGGSNYLVGELLT